MKSVQDPYLWEKDKLKQMFATTSPKSIIKISDSKCWRELGKEVLFTVGVVKVNTVWKSVWRLFSKLKIELPDDPAIPPLCIYPKNSICKSMFVADVFTRARKWSQLVPIPSLICPLLLSQIVFWRHCQIFKIDSIVISFSATVSKQHNNLQWSLFWLRNPGVHLGGEPWHKQEAEGCIFYCWHKKSRQTRNGPVPYSFRACP